VIAAPLLAGLTPCEVIPSPRPNFLQLLFDRPGLRESIENFEEVASTLLARIERELLLETDANDIRRTYFARPELQALRDRARPGAQHAMILPLRIRLGDLKARLISTMTTLGTAQDVTLQELRVESFYPADAETEQLLRDLAST
jgi:MmyB-like transcription regulator ligand binding domain